MSRPSTGKRNRSVLYFTVVCKRAALENIAVVDNGIGLLPIVNVLYKAPRGADIAAVFNIVCPDSVESAVVVKRSSAVTENVVGSALYKAVIVNVSAIVIVKRIVIT